MLRAPAALLMVAGFMLAVPPASAAEPSPTGSLTRVASFGANPSHLDMDVYLPARPAQRPALLVALHGCASSAQAFADGAARDFVAAADQDGFLIVFPEATRDGRCFDVSSPQALTRGAGSDPVGIMSMVAYARKVYHVANDRIVLTGVATGAAMANVLAAEYPEVFAAGSAFSGMPAGCPAGAEEPLNSECAAGQVVKTPEQWGDLARSMNPGYRGRYPRMQLWHGTADGTVSPANLGESVKQWTNLHGVDPTSPVTTDSPEPLWTRTRYGTADKMALVEGMRVDGAGHTLPGALMVSYAVSFLGLDGASYGRRLPSAYQWTSGDILLSPKPDATHDLIAVKDPTVVRYAGQWLVYATTVDRTGHWGLQATVFRDWKDAPNAVPYQLDQSAIGAGYRAAPQLFYFQPGNLWYLVFQCEGGACYSTTTDPTKPATWSETKYFFSAMPDIIRDNKGRGSWLDMWTICDEVNCYLFSSDNNGHLYRSQTTVQNFPNGFGDTVIALDSPNSKFRLWEASNVYKIRGSDTYLLLVEASSNARYFRAWTSNRLDGRWTPLAGSELNPFAGEHNVTFAGTPWSRSVSHGEMIRDGYDQRLIIPPHDFQFLYQGLDPAASTIPYTYQPWRIGLITQTGPAAPADGTTN